MICIACSMSGHTPDIQDPRLFYVDHSVQLECLVMLAAAAAAAGDASSRLQVVAGDVTDPASLPAALEGATGVWLSLFACV
jgi:hypothetical protein